MLVGINFFQNRYTRSIIILPVRINSKKYLAQTKKKDLSALTKSLEISFLLQTALKHGVNLASKLEMLLQYINANLTLLILSDPQETQSL